MAEHLGLTWSGQLERLQRDEVLRGIIRRVRVTQTPDRGSKQRNALPTLALPTWLVIWHSIWLVFNIHAARGHLINGLS